MQTKVASVFELPAVMSDAASRFCVSRSGTREECCKPNDTDGSSTPQKTGKVRILAEPCSERCAKSQAPGFLGNSRKTKVPGRPQAQFLAVTFPRPCFRVMSFLPSSSQHEFGTFKALRNRLQEMRLEHVRQIHFLLVGGGG